MSKPLQCEHSNSATLSAVCTVMPGYKSVASTRIVGRPVSAHVSVRHRTNGLLSMSWRRALSSATREMTPCTF